MKGNKIMKNIRTSLRENLDFSLRLKLKKFAKSLVVPVLIGMGIGIFVARVVGPVFNLDRFTIGATAAVSAGVLLSWWWIFIESRKKKNENR